MNVVRAAVGILVDAHGRVLVSRRPASRPCAGKWEFPGGKIEAREDCYAALRREVSEEVGVEVTDAARLLSHVNEFPDRVVHLDVWVVRAWRGEAFGAEGQVVRWVDPDEARELDFLPGLDAILPALKRRLRDAPRR